MNAVLRFDMANSFSPGDKASFAQVAEHAGLTEAATKSLLRHAMTMRIFSEPEKGVVAHTARSVLFRDEKFTKFMGTGLEEMVPSALKVS